ncbi:hypothetical protein N9O74_01000 [Methylophilaceae bacterium]|nr:hypothetical protein [Methylophilaceae bacterium]|tara:strand:- start:2109 stop:2519 length:411 start_codon:yes stop_codon:yes gene_type:complete
MNISFNFIILFLFFSITGCSTSLINERQYPAPHNDFSGKTVNEYYGGEDSNSFMIRSCKIYGGLNQESISKSGSDFIMQDILEFKCNHAGKLKEGLNIDGKSSKRLSGSVAKIKCERLGFNIGTPSFTNCMKELTQ